MFEVTIHPDKGLDETIRAEFWEDVIVDAFTRSKEIDSPLSFQLGDIEVRIDENTNRSSLLHDYNMARLR